MVDVEPQGDAILFTVRGLHKLLALKSELLIPRSHILGARLDPAAAQHLRGLRAGGTYFPGLVAAGTFYLDGRGSQRPFFLDVSNPANTVVVALRDEHYHQLIIEVADPAAVVALLADPAAPSR